MSSNLIELLCVCILLFNMQIHCEPSCGVQTSVDLSHGLQFPNGSVLFQNIYYEVENQIQVTNNNGDAIKRGCTCSIKTCVRKCCGAGDVLRRKKCKNNSNVTLDTGFKVYNNEQYLPDFDPSKEFGWLYNMHCKKNYSATREEQPILLQTNGSLLTNESNMLTIYTRDEYCVDYVELPDKGEGTKYRLDALICFPEQKVNVEHASKIKILSSAMLISLPFLVATLAVYCILPELHNLHGYIMITYLSCLIAFFAFLSAIQISTANSKISISMCLFMDFAVYFSSMASFFWMNVMCFDIWWTFSGQRSWQGIGHGSIKKRYMLYSIYAWLIPTLLTFILAYMQFDKTMWDNHIIPGFGVKSCWFHENRAQFVYMYLPIGVLLACNLILFSATTYRIFSISRETQMLQENQTKKRTFEKERQRFFLYIKLFTVMGLNWILEIVSFFVDMENKAWVISDVFNTLIGVFVFIIFVLKKKILKLLVKRYMPCFGENVMKRVETTTTLRSMDGSMVMNPTNLQKNPSNSTVNSEAKSDAL